MRRLVCLICAASILLAVSRVFAQEGEKPPEPAPGGIQWEPNFDKALEKARKGDLMIMIFFYKAGSKMCADFEKNSIEQPAVRELSKKFVCLKVDRDKDKATAGRFAINAIPQTLFITAEQKKLTQIVGYEDPGPFAKKVKEIYESVKIEKEAREILRNKDPEDLEANLKLAKVYIVRGALELAMALFQKIVDKDPENEKGFLVEVAFHLGKLQLEGGLVSKGKENFAKVRKYDQKDAKGFGDDILLHEAKMDLSGRPPDADAALKKLRKLVEKYPKSELVPDALFKMGHAYYAAGKNEKAIEAWEKLVKEYPDSPEAGRAKSFAEELKKAQK